MYLIFKNIARLILFVTFSNVKQFLMGRDITFLLLISKKMKKNSENHK